MYSTREFGASTEFAASTGFGANAAFGANAEFGAGIGFAASTEFNPVEPALLAEPGLKNVTDAIERLDASWRTADPADLEAQVAAVWELIEDMNPELAKVAQQYS